ncbi:MAG TPA: helix-turn-helix transcriptional regulator, partial [Candidatus Limnocylindrales bacterium]|nr:helix-turn-helix transcriptional regulator [Candidatus Limnocylindrales bacterium]
MDDLRIGLVTRAVRHRQGLRQSDLAGRAGVSQQEISLFERLGLTAVDLRTARRICAPLGV